MKTTYLINKIQPDGSIELSISTFEEWRAVIEANRVQLAAKRRYFIVDCIVDGSNIDRMVIETSAAEYRKWNKERMASARNRALGQNYQILSLDAPVQIEEVMLHLKETLSSNEKIEETVCSQIFTTQLREALTAWKPWANDILDYYLRGEQRTCTDALSTKYGVSPQVIRKYKRQFEKFIKNFWGGVSF